MAGRKKAKIVSKAPYYGRRTKSNGKRERVGTKITTSDGVVVTLLTPNGYGAKYAAEMKNNKRYTNSGIEKKDKRLSEHGRAYRSGYLKARKDSARAYKAKQNKRGK